ncbi:MAG: hypothetical protein MZU79_06815 [Anaerotruncus sp.]|nr:hypothetical protein [Anaerotruncus sp.]
MEDWKGAYLIINNGNIGSVINYPRDYSARAVVDVALNHANDYEKAAVTLLQNFVADHRAKSIRKWSNRSSMSGLSRAPICGRPFRLTAKSPARGALRR